MKAKKKEHIKKISMKNQMTKSIIYLLFFTLFLNFTSCKTQSIQQKAPFNITEKSYFKWVGGKKGNQGTTIKIVGNFETTSLGFSNIYFQNYKYKVVPEINGSSFTLIGSRSSYKKDMNMSGNAVDEYGNTPPKIDKYFPFDLQKDEAVIEYSINGQVYFQKVESVKQLETVYYP